MRTASSGHSGSSNAGEIAALRKQIDLLSRRLDKQPKIPPPAAAPGTQIVQVEQIEYVADSASVHSYDQGSSMAYSEIIWGVGADPSGRIDAASWAWIDPAQPWRIGLAEGLYQAGMVLSLGWDSQAAGPERVEVTFNGGWNAVTASRPVHSGRQKIAFNRWGFLVLHNPGVFYSDGTDFLQPEASFGGEPTAASTAGHCAITITRFL